MSDVARTTRFRFWLWLIKFIGLIVPRRLRADWRQEWEAELRCRETLLADWDKLDWRSKLDLLRRSLGAFRDALFLQPRRLEDKMFQDFRFGVRMLLKQPTFTLIAVLTLSLGIGATSAVFSLIQGVLLTPPPYRRPERIALITTARTDGQQTSSTRGWPAAQWLEWQKEAKSFEAIAAYRWSFSFLISEDGSESIEGMVVTKDYFSVTGLKPYLGRTFQDSDAVVNGPQVIILGYGLWQRRFNGDSNIIGKTIPFRGETPPTVIGVMPPGVRFLPSPTVAGDPNYNVNAQVEWWMPTRLNPPAALKFAMWNVAGRLQNGATLAGAQAELASITARQAQADRDFAGVTARTQSMTAEMNRDGRRILLPLLGAAALVLLIACGNVAALLLVRGLQRQQEYAVRCALGAGRVALFRQVSMESLLLALLGGALGVGLAFGVVKLFKLIGGHAIPRLDAVTTGWPVLACGLGAAAIAALLAGFLPAMRAARLDPMIALKDAGPKSSAGRGERRLLRGVTVIQTALTLALFVGAGLLIRTMNNLSKVNAGYNTEKILTMSVTAPKRDMRDQVFHQQALERVSRLPGVEHAAFGWGVPLTSNNSPFVVEIEGQPAASKPSDLPVLPARVVGEGYFKLLGQPLVAGRDFRSTDNRDSPRVAIINQAFADRYFPQANPIGKKLWSFGRRDLQIEIIGVIANGRTDDLTKAAEPEIYTSLWQFFAFTKHLLVRTEADPRALIAGVQRELRAIDPTVSIENLKTLEEIRGDSLASRSFAMRLLIGFSIVAGALTLVGIYGVLSLSVAARRRELAIRTAMGAGRRELLKLVLGEGLRLIAGGVTAGLAAAIVLSRVLRSFLFEVEPTDPVTLIVVGLLFVGVALLACWAPARRAAKVDPLEALRYE
ncbi:MAG TPA: ABC transporter permease [Blastocatellia bacterium]|jgi:putative ABC transport system permease protein|nr:ABC transporter permease [Blastocatellia bacterium]